MLPPRGRGEEEREEDEAGGLAVFLLFLVACSFTKVFSFSSRSFLRACDVEGLEKWSYTHTFGPEHMSRYEQGGGERLRACER